MHFSPSVKRPRALYLLALLALLSTVAKGQSPFVKFSGPVMRPHITADAMIQAAARIGGTTLVAWGSTEASGGNPSATVIYVQALRDSTPLGSPRRLTASGSHPAGFIQVLPFSDHFVVVWENRVGGDSLTMMSVVDAGGAPLGAATMLHNTAIASTGVLLVRSGAGYALYWSDVRGDSYTQTLDASGFPSAAAVPLPGVRLGGLLDLSSTAGYIVIDRGDSIPLAFTASGQPINLRGAGAKFGGTFHIGPDGSVVVLRNDTLAVYASVLDSVATRRSVVVLPGGAIRGSEVVTRDTAGTIQILIAIGGGSLAGSTESLHVILCRLIEQQPGRARRCIRTGDRDREKPVRAHNG